MVSPAQVLDPPYVKDRLSRLLAALHALRSGQASGLPDSYWSAEGNADRTFAKDNDSRWARPAVVVDGATLPVSLPYTPPAASVTPDSTEPCVLIIDDDASMRRLVQAILKNSGARCLVAADGDEARVLLAGCQPDVAIIDINLPGMDGLEVMGMIRSRVPGVRIMLMSARDTAFDILNGFHKGADDYVPKPFIGVELGARLESLLNAPSTIS